MSLRHVIAVAAFLAAAPLAAALAQVPALLEVPENAPEPEASALVAERAGLKERLAGLQRRAGRFNVRCVSASVEEGSADEAWCIGEDAELTGLKTNYVADANAFNTRVRALASKAAQGGIPARLVGKTTPFVPGGKYGIVKAAARDWELNQNYDAATDAAFFANYFETGDDSQLTLYSLSGERIRILENTTLELGPVLDAQDFEQGKGEIKYGEDYDLSISKLVGKVRFDYLPAVQEKINLATAYAFHWFKKAKNRRFQVRTPKNCACVRGTDFSIEGEANGAMTITVYEGEVVVEPLDGGDPVTLGPGDTHQLESPND